MASIKIGSLILRTIAKPFATALKNRSKEHERSRELIISVAQFVHRSEINMRTKLLGENLSKVHVRPLNDAKALDTGASFISEAFMFTVAVSIILAETWRSSRNTKARRDMVAETLAEHELAIADLESRLDEAKIEQQGGFQRERELENIIEEIVGIGLRGGWLTAPTPEEWARRIRLADEAKATEILPRAAQKELSPLLEKVAELSKQIE